MNRDEIIKCGQEVVNIELQAIQKLAARIDEQFARAVELISECKGGVILTGMGKSGIVGKKIAATMTSVGTMAIFMHPAEGIHGDLGLVTGHEVIIAISKGGETMELNRLIPIFRRYDCKIIAMTANTNSHLARFADVTLDISVPKEACPFDLAPTSSTTVSLVLGDALAIALLKIKHFQLTDYARNHPGGSIGRSLLKVEDLMHSGDTLPTIGQDKSMREALLEMTGKRLGMTTVVNNRAELVGIITDGDLRRWLERSGDPLNDVVREVMIRNPKTIEGQTLAPNAIELMEHHGITSLVIIDETKHPRGVIHLHDLVKSGVSFRGRGHLE